MLTQNVQNLARGMSDVIFILGLPAWPRHVTNPYCRRRPCLPRYRAHGLFAASTMHSAHMSDGRRAAEKPSYTALAAPTAICRTEPPATRANTRCGAASPVQRLRDTLNEYV